jgi:hypothetical protein
MPRIIYLLAFLFCSMAAARDAVQAPALTRESTILRDPDVQIRRPLRSGEPGGVRPSS